MRYFCSILILLQIICFNLTAKENDNLLFDLKVNNGKILAKPAKYRIEGKGVKIITPQGKKDKVLQLNQDGAKDSFIRVYSSAIKNNGAPLNRKFTIEVSFKPADIFKAQQLVHKLVWWSRSGYSDGAFSLGFKDGVPVVSIWTFNKKLRKGRQLTKCSGGQLISDNWNYLAAVFDGKKLKLFVNGKKSGECDVPQGVFPYSKYDRPGSIFIGNSCYTNRLNYSGLIGRVRVKNSASEQFFFDENVLEKLRSGENNAKSTDNFRYQNTIGRIGPRPGSYITPLKDALIVSPDDPDSMAQAQKIANKTGLEIITSQEAVKGRCEGLKKLYQNRNLILLGNINNNEAIIPLYAKFLSWADADYPGKAGYAIRTIRNPYGTLSNNILIAASDEKGLQKAVEVFLNSRELDLQKKSCGYLFKINPVFSAETQKEIAKLRSKVSSFIKKGCKDSTGITIGFFSVAYYLTGDAKFKKAMKAYAEKITEKIYPSFVVGHYRWENFVRTLEIITSTNIVNAETVRKLDINLYLSLYQMRNDFGIRRYKQAPGGRHQLPPSVAYLMFCELLKRNIDSKTSSNVRNFVEANYKGIAEFFKHLSNCTYSGSDDSSSTAANMTSIMQAAMLLGDTTVFENNLAREGAKKMICITDNWGYGAGAGTYEDAYEEGMTKKKYVNGGPLCYTAFYYKDSGLKWIKENVKGMEFSSWFARTWFGLHKYATGSYLKAVKPSGKYMVTYCKPRPLTIDKYNEVGGFEKASLFDKAVIRTGASDNDAYICFQGNGSAKEGSWSSASDTLVLLRYVNRGVLWLANNTQLNGAAWRNSFIVSDGSKKSIAALPYAKLNQLDSNNRTFSASVREVRGGVWTRRAVYFGDGNLFIADTFTAGKKGNYSFLQTFKTPVPSKLENGDLVALKSGLKLSSASSGKCSVSIDNGVRRMEPQRFWYYRKSYDKSLAKGQKVTLATVFKVSNYQPESSIRLAEISPESFRVIDNGKYFQIDLKGRGISIKGTNVSGNFEEKTSRKDKAFGKYKILTRISRNFAPGREKLRGWKLISPDLENKHVIDDNIVKRWDRGYAYDGAKPLEINLMRKASITGIEFMDHTLKHKGKPKFAASIKVEIELSDNKDFSNPIKQQVILEHKPDMRELYKMGAWQVQGYCGNFSALSGKYLRIKGIPGKNSELSIYSDKEKTAGIKKMRAVDLDSDGVEELLVETQDRRLLAFDSKGHELFCIKVPFEIIDFIAEDLDKDGKVEIVFPCFDLCLYKYNWQGKLIKISKPLFQHPYTINILTDRNTGNKKIALTYYYHHQFFDKDLKTLFKPKGFGAMWTENAAVIDINGDGIDDIVMSDIYARGYTVNGANGDVSNLFWAVHGIFNGIYPALPVEAGERKVLFAGTSKIMCRKLRIAKKQPKNAEWSFCDGSQFSSAVVSGKKLLAARFSGHVLVINSLNGQLEKMAWVKGRIFDIKCSKNRIFIATDNGLKIYDNNLKKIAFLPGCCTKIVLTKSGIWIELSGQIMLVKQSS